MSFERFRAEVGTRIMKARRARNLTQARLAEQVNCTQSNITQIECGAIFPGPETLYNLAIALDVPAGAFFPDTVPNAAFGPSVFRLLWERIRNVWRRRTHNKSGLDGS